VVQLDPGWNAVYLEVRPEPGQCDLLFQSTPFQELSNLEGVWCWNPPLSSAEFIDVPPDPCSLEPGQAEWLAYFPPAYPEHAISNLFAITGGKSYLIKLGGDQSVTWRVLGRPCLPRIDWQPRSYNLVGFHVNEGGDNPYFQHFFSTSSAHVYGDQGFIQPAYTLNNASGQWERIQFPGTVQVEHGKAYWVYAQDPSEFTGPLTVDVEQGDGFDFDRILVEQSLNIANISESDVNIEVNHIGSLSPSDPNNGSVDGDVPLMYLSEPNDIWTDLPASDMLAIEPLGSGQTTSLQLAVDRSDSKMSYFGGYHSILEITSDEGMRLHVPVSAKGTDPCGLWVGSVAVDKVSELAGGEPNAVPTSTEFQFRLILHVDSNEPNENVFLLKDVIELWKETTYIKDPNTGNYIEDPNTGEKVVHEDGRFVLLTDKSYITDEYRPAGMRAGQVRGRRISSAAFSFDEPQQMTGTLSERSLSCSISIDSSDALNPFRHIYHPDHDEADPNSGEIYEITRTIDLTFTKGDPEGLALKAGWGDTDMGGIYRETVVFERKPDQAIHVKGIFRLHRVSRIDALNDGKK
jgi:hypothetical protein